MEICGLIVDRMSIQKDEHVSDLLLFHPSTSFEDDEAYKKGQIILQDKASCFPAVILDPPGKDNSYVIDATSAPGNKTTLLSALMKGKGKVKTEIPVATCLPCPC